MATAGVDLAHETSSLATPETSLLESTPSSVAREASLAAAAFKVIEGAKGVAISSRRELAESDLKPVSVENILEHVL